MTLAELQHQFANALCYHADGEQCGINSDHFSAEQRLQIYRNHFVVSLGEVLSATYPLLEQVLGEACFAQIARHHVLHHPLNEGDVTHYGAGLAETVGQFTEVLKAAPYAVALAEFEWQIDRARQAQAEQRPATCQPMEKLAEVPAEQYTALCLHLRPGVLCLASDYAVFDLWHAIHQQHFDDLDLSQPQVGVIAAHADGRLQLQSLSDAAYQLMFHVKHQHSLGAIPPALLSGLNDLMQHDWLCGFSLQHNSECTQGDTHV